MILLPEDLDSDSKKLGHQDSVIVQRELSDPPPTYFAFPRQASNQSSNGPSIPTQDADPHIRPTNFVYLSPTNSKIQGSWVVDPALIIPYDFLPRLSPGETELSRKNVSLKTTNGSIDADISLLPTSIVDVATKQLRGRILIHTSSTNGPIITKIHDPGNGTRLPLEISTSSTNGRIEMCLPRSFKGPLRIKQTNGGLHFSNAVNAMLTTFSEVRGMHRSFLGPLDAISNLDRNAKWEGDELYAESSNGRISIRFDDEADPRISQPPQSRSRTWPFN